MNEEAVEPQAEIIEETVEQVDPEQQEVSQENIDHESKAYEKTMVPLSALQKLREKKKELELELQWERQKHAQAASKPIEDDNSRYESATREDLDRSQEEIVRIVEEKTWIRNNPEKYEKINEFLPQFLKQRPNLAAAINQASNRYEEAYTLMEALSPKQQQQIKKDSGVVKKQAPNAPGGIPKAAALNETVDVMNMSDSEFSAWKQSKKRNR